MLTCNLDTWGRVWFAECIRRRLAHELSSLPVRERRRMARWYSAYADRFLFFKPINNYRGKDESRILADALARGYFDSSWVGTWCISWLAVERAVSNAWAGTAWSTVLQPDDLAEYPE